MRGSGRAVLYERRVNERTDKPSDTSLLNGIDVTAMLAKKRSAN